MPREATHGHQLHQAGDSLALSGTIQTCRSPEAETRNRNYLVSRLS
jgi:hypothetical protein